MIEPQIWAVVVLVPATTAALSVVLCRCCPRRCWLPASTLSLHRLSPPPNHREFGFTAGYICGFLALRILRAISAGSTDRLDVSQFLSVAREQVVRLWSPRTVGDWLPLLVATICLLACASVTSRQLWLRRLFWWTQPLVFVGFLAWQYRKTRYFSLPSPESTALLVQAGAIALIGWMALTWRRQKSAAAAESSQLAPVGRMGGMGVMGITSGVVLCGLLGLSGSLTLATEALLVPAALAGVLLGGLNQRAPSFPTATWAALSLSYVLQGILLSQLSPISAWLWTGGAALAVGYWHPPTRSAPWIHKLLRSGIPIALFALALGLAARQFWLDTH